MLLGEYFNRSVTVLANAVRERLDGDTPLDWTLLEDAATGTRIDDAVRTCHRLPGSVEGLARRLIQDLGIVPADLVAGSERQGAAGAWIHWVSLEAEAGSYHLRNERSGQLHAGVRPEALAGYAVLGLELCAAIHEASERWMEAGERHERVDEGERTPLARCAVRMRAHLRARRDEDVAQRSAALVARLLERAWNTQSLEVRAALAGVRLSTARGARAPRRSYYAPATGHRLSACDAGEIRWLRALAERALMGRGEATPEAREALPRANGGTEREDSEASLIRAEAPRPQPDILTLGPAPENLVPETVATELERVANHLPGAVQRRMGEAYGADVAQALARFQSPRESAFVRAEIAKAASGEGVAEWLAGLATALLADTGAQTREGTRTGSVRLASRREPDGGHRGTEVETGAIGFLTPIGLVEQVRSSLAFAHEAWAGLMALRSAGKEGDWTLNEAETGGSQLGAGENETLEAAREIGQALGRIQRAFSEANEGRSASALEQAAMAVETLRSVGPTIRTAAGWPGGTGAPEARDPEDIARIASVAEALHAEIRAIANRLIAGWIAEVQEYGESRRA